MIINHRKMRNSWIMCFVYLINFKMQENQRIECLKGWPLNQLYQYNEMETESIMVISMIYFRRI